MMSTFFILRLSTTILWRSKGPLLAGFKHPNSFTTNCLLKNNFYPEGLHRYKEHIWMYVWQKCCSCKNAHLPALTIIAIEATRRFDFATYRNTQCLDLALKNHLFYLRSPFSKTIWRRKYIFTGKIPTITTQPRAEPAHAHACTILRNKEEVRASVPQRSGYYKNKDRQLSLRVRIFGVN